MALVAMASGRSAGLTTCAVALALSWPRKVLLAELDPDGGTIAAGRAANADPGLKTLAATGRHYLSPGLVTSNVQDLPGGLAVLLSPVSPDRCVAALAALNPVGLGETLRAIPDLDVIADCGRIDSNSPALPVLREADVVVFVVRPTLVDIVGLRARLETLELSPTTRSGIVVVRHGPHSLDDVLAAFRIPVVGAVDWDPRAASALGEGRRVLGRSKLMQSAQRLAVALSAEVDPDRTAHPDSALEGPVVDVADTARHVSAQSHISAARRGIPSAWAAPGGLADNQTAADSGVAR